MDNASIKENIIRIRTERGISQDEMARALGISRNSYRSIEKGMTCLINKRLGEIAKILGVPVEELALGYQPIESEERLEDIRIKGRFKYSELHEISTEGRQKLEHIDPDTLGQASRIPGVSPSDINVMLVLLGR